MLYYICISHLVIMYCNISHYIHFIYRKHLIISWKMLISFFSTFKITSWRCCWNKDMIDQAFIDQKYFIVKSIKSNNNIISVYFLFSATNFPYSPHPCSSSSSGQSTMPSHLQLDCMHTPLRHSNWSSLQPSIKCKWTWLFWYQSIAF